MRETEYAIVVLPLREEDGGGFMAAAPDLQGCMSDGETQEEAVQNARLAVLEWIDEATEAGIPIPPPGTASRAIQDQMKALEDLVREQESVIESFEPIMARVKAALSSLDEERKGGFWNPPFSLVAAQAAGKEVEVH